MLAWLAISAGLWMLTLAIVLSTHSQPAVRYVIKAVTLSFHQCTCPFGRFASNTDSYQMDEANVSDRNITYYEAEPSRVRVLSVLR